MYAILSTSGSQYRIEPGTVLKLNRLAGGVGDTVTLDDSVLLVKSDAGTAVGTPHVDGVSVDLEIQAHCRSKKIIVFKKKRRKRSRSKRGHRQDLTQALVRVIRVPGQEPFEFVGEPEPEVEVLEPESTGAAEEAVAVSEEAVSEDTPEETAEEAVEVEAAAPATEGDEAVGPDADASAEADTGDDDAESTDEDEADEDDSEGEPKKS